MVELTKQNRLERCDDLLTRSEELEADLKALAAAMPLENANLERFILKTADCAHVTVARLNTIYNSIRRNT